MIPETETAAQQRARWWQSQRSTFGLPDRLYSPLPFAAVAVTTLGVGGGLLGLLPGVNTQEATLSDWGAPWIGLMIVLIVSGVWTGHALRHGYSPLSLAIIVAFALVLAVGINSLSLDVLVEAMPDTFIGGLGLSFVFGPLLLAIGLIFDGFILSVYMGTFMGVLLGGLAGFPISFSSLMLMAVMYGTIGGLAGGLAAVVRSQVKRLRRERAGAGSRS